MSKKTKEDKKKAILEQRERAMSKELLDENLKTKKTQSEAAITLTAFRIIDTGRLGRHNSVQCREKCT